MNLHLRRTYPIVLVFTLLMLALAYLSPGFPGAYSLPFFVLVMVTTGLPHGATDHLIDRYQQEQQGKSFSWHRFLAVYLGAIVLYGILWIGVPLLSLAVFLLISAFHFGQSQFLYVEGPENSPFKWALYLTWGLCILTAIIGLNAKESGQVLAALIPQTQWTGLASWMLVALGIFGVATVGLLSWARFKGHLSRGSFGRELGHLLLLTLLSWQADLLLTFAVYFGLWHSLASISYEIRIMQEERPNFSWRDFVKAALPFSLISIVGIGMLLGTAYWLEEWVSLYLLFFMAISVLTLPHMVFMQGFYYHGQKKLLEFL